MRLPASPLGAAITAHLTALAASGYAASTLVSRRAQLAAWCAWCDARGITTVAHVSPALLERYREALALVRHDDRALGWTTQAQHLTAIRSFCTWAVRAKRLAVNPAADLTLPRLPKRLPRAVLSAAEVERVLAVPNTTTPLGLRDRAILEVLYSTGIRRAELVGLGLVDLDAARGVLFIRDGKGKKDRVVPIGLRAITWTHRYLVDARPVLVRTHGTDALFVSSRGTRIRPTRLTERLHRYLVTAGITKPGSVHIFRHTVATLMHEHGADIRDLQELLGHADLATTEVYTHVSIARLKAVHERTHPASVHASRARGHAPASSLAAIAAEGEEA